MSDRNFGRHPVTPSPRHPWPLLTALLVLCLGWEVQAESISIIASDNAGVWKNQAGNDISEAESLSVQNNMSAQHRLAYLRFDLAPLAGTTDITSASLDLYWLSATSDSNVSVYALNDLADAGKGTSETTWTSILTWNNQPQGTVKPPNANTSGVLAGLPFVKGDEPKLASFDLTSALPGLLATDTNNQLTLILYHNSAATNTFASLANTKDYPVPTLTVDYTNPIPEPGTLALLGMAFLGLGFYGWRKRR